MHMSEQAISIKNLSKKYAGGKQALSDVSMRIEPGQVLRRQRERMRAELRAIAANTNKTAKILVRVSQDGESLQTTVAA